MGGTRGLRDAQIVSHAKKQKIPVPSHHVCQLLGGLLRDGGWPAGSPKLPCGLPTAHYKMHKTCMEKEGEKPKTY